MTIQNTQLVFDPAHYQFEEGTHRNRKVIWVRFPKDEQLLEALRFYTKPKWSSSQKCWYVADADCSLVAVGSPLDRL